MLRCDFAVMPGAYTKSVEKIRTQALNEVKKGFTGRAKKSLKFVLFKPIHHGGGDHEYTEKRAAQSGYTGCRTAHRAVPVRRHSDGVVLVDRAFVCGLAMAGRGYSQANRLFH